MTNVTEKNEAPKNNTPALRKGSIVAVAHLKTLNAIMLAEDEQVGTRFVDIYNKVHGTDKGEMVYNAEKFYYMRQLQENEKLRECSALSLYGAFLDVAVNGLSFDPSKKLCYLIPGNHNVGTRENPIWEKRAALAISPDGEIAIRQNKKQISHCDNPVIVYEGDKFDILVTAKGTAVNYAAKFPRAANARILGAFIRIVRPDGTVDFSVMQQSDIERLQGYSSRKNNGKANALYTSGPNNQIDTGFLMAKVKKHAFDSYPKVIAGNFAVAAPIETAPEEVVHNFYNLDEETTTTAPGENTDAPGGDYQSFDETSEAPAENPAKTIKHKGDEVEGF